MPTFSDAPRLLSSPTVSSAVLNSMASAAYHWPEALQTAIKRNRRDAHNRYLQLATVRGDGSPAVRTLVYRSFCDTSMQLRMITDRRSAKVDEIRAQAPGEICWYFTHSREQFRLSGQLVLTGPEATEQATRLELWTSLSDAAREQFFWPEPGSPLTESRFTIERDGDHPPDTFLVLALGVNAVDHLCLRGSPQTRWRSWREASGDWQSEAINP